MSSSEVTSMAVSSSAAPPEEDVVAESLCPSHILADGRFVHLPPPTDREQISFFERSIAKHGLLQGDLEQKKKEQPTETPTESNADKPKVHPLAMASGRLQGQGIQELNRVINLSSLVASGEYFGLSNIVDPALEIPASNTAATTTTKEKSEDSKDASDKSSTAATPAATTPKDPASTSGEYLQEPRIRADYCLTSKKRQFQKATSTLQRHRERLQAAVAVQIRPDQQLRRLRPQWRLAAPEHGQRARPHPARPVEVVAADVDVYGHTAVLGRLAKRIPRYATLELHKDYKVDKDLKAWRLLHFGPDDTQNDDDAMQVDENEDAKEQQETQPCTYAEPFAIADPSLGKLDADFDPAKVTMLTLQLDIEKARTGFCARACLVPFSNKSTSTTALNASGMDTKQDDESASDVLVSLQHSLFCAKLFESIRRELAADTDEVGQIRTTADAQSVVWTHPTLEDNHLPPPLQLSSQSSTESAGLLPLAVIHVHEGEVKVQLDCEYTLRVALVEKSDQASTSTHGTDSGSRTPTQLLTLCKALLWHAQDCHHQHSMRTEKNHDEESQQTPQQIHLRKTPVEQNPLILQRCVTLGAKRLFESRILSVFDRVRAWLQPRTGEPFRVEFLSLSVLDVTTYMTLQFGEVWNADACLTGDALTVTRQTEQGSTTKTTFYDDGPFELYLKLALGRELARNGHGS